MCKIQPITKYKFKDVEYNSLKEVQDKVHNMIGEEVIDTINRKIELKHKDLFTLLEILCDKRIRNVLTECYNVKFEKVEHDSENGEYSTELINILDVKF